MNPQVEEALKTTLENWRIMQSSDIYHASEDADRFESSFYEFIEQLGEWVKGMENKPTRIEEALVQPEFAEILELLPPPLHLNFETELELILDGIERTLDVKTE